ncbi:GNAT family N-acetyltransferase [Chitiniphilus shinanonensis]|uniref:GNAT family N-acetyltransferase n=1 Tax=Chitiniphilus shinanonensis TaxID=553088 RepID=UPI00303D28C1
MSFLIRPATPADVPAVLAMIRELAEFERLTHLVQNTEAMLHDTLFGERPTVECVVGVEGDAPVAFALFFHNYSTFVGRRGLYLEDVYVRPVGRGKGYGGALVRHLARLAQQRGCGRFEWTVLDWNENAIGFYRGLGADVLPDWRICRVTGDALARLAAS